MSQLRRIGVGPRLSEAAIYQGTVYLAGQVPEKTIDQGIGPQTSEVLSMIDHLLSEAGSDKTQILMCQIFLADLGDFPGMNEIWDAWVVPGHTPPRATVESQLANPKHRVEIVVTAACGKA